MKKFDSEQEFFNSIEEGDIGFVIGIRKSDSSSISDAINFVIFKITKESEETGNFHGDYIAIIYKGDSNTKTQSPKPFSFEIEFCKDTLVCWQNTDKRRKKVEIMAFIFDERTNNPEYYLLDEKDNPEEVFQKALNFGAPSENIFKSLMTIIENLRR